MGKDGEGWGSMGKDGEGWGRMGKDKKGFGRSLVVQKNGLRKDTERGRERKDVTGLFKKIKLQKKLSLKQWMGF